MKENKLFPQMILYEFRHSWPSCGYYRRDLVPYGSFPPFYIYLSKFKIEKYFALKP